MFEYKQMNQLSLAICRLRKLEYLLFSHIGIITQLVNKNITSNVMLFLRDLLSQTNVRWSEGRSISAGTIS